MKYKDHPMPRRTRHGFTAIELLVTITIIGILAALILAGVNMMRSKQLSTTTQVELREMKVALENFKTRYSIYPPSQITVGPSAVDAESQRLLLTLWPSLSMSEAFGPKGWGLTSNVTLKGDQCLVLFLGGRHDGAGCQGFSTSKVNPFALGSDRDQPFFKFKGERLIRRDPNSPFHSYGDGFFKTIYKGAEQLPCYAYFAATRAGYVDTHCDSLKDAKGNFPRPYKQSATVYLNKQGYQILSSGRDTFWGTARVWSADGGLLDAASDPSGEGMDNMADFSPSVLSGS
jgi:prepilin-type N-terminal cleavage/methylation domain-containing protein